MGIRRRPQGRQADSPLPPHNAITHGRRRSGGSRPAAAQRSAVLGPVHEAQRCADRRRHDLSHRRRIGAAAEEPSPQDQGWAGRVQANVRRWRFGRLLMILAPGALVTVVAWTAFSTFSTVNQNYNASPFAYIVRYALLMLGLFVPLVLFVLTWW